MTKNRNEKKRSGAVAMDINEFSEMPQAMDTSDSGALKAASGMLNIKTKGGRPMKRAKNVRKKKAIEKAISKNEIHIEKTLKKESKLLAVQSAKTLYD